MPTNPQILVPFASYNYGISTLYADIGTGGVQGGYAGPVAVTLSAALTLLQRPPGYPTLPGLTGAASQDVAGKVLANGGTYTFFAPEAAAIVAAELGTIVAYQ